MDNEEFRRRAHELVDWMADYVEQVRNYPVKSPVLPGTVKSQIPDSPPRHGEDFDSILRDFREIIIPGMTHWQSPGFHAYFPANSSPPSILAEMLTATLGAQCMIWQTSPAAAELEEVTMRWLGQMIGIPEDWDGVIHDTASVANLCSLLTAREKRSDYDINQRGFPNDIRYTVYGSQETHSSVDKAVRIAGLGQQALRKVAVDDKYAMDPSALKQQIEADKRDGCHPLAVMATIGTTGSTAIDPLSEIGEVCRRHELWLHVDAAFAGTALVLPDMRWMINGIEQADSFVFNPHKWMFTNFDCSAYFVKDREALIRTFEILPEYLKTQDTSTVNNYRDWGVQLGRRFRALKLWFVIRTYGVDGLEAMIRKHLKLAREFVGWIEERDDFELLAPAPLPLVCFRYHPVGTETEESLNRINAEILERINRTGRIFMTHTKLNGRFTLRFVCANTYVERPDIEKAWEIITETASRIAAP